MPLSPREKKGQVSATSVEQHMPPVAKVVLKPLCQRVFGKGTEYWAHTLDRVLGTHTLRWALGLAVLSTFLVSPQTSPAVGALHPHNVPEARP